MNQFETELKKGNFLIGECPSCKIVIWPPSEFCSKCFGNITWRNSENVGELVEFSKKEDTYFGIVEFENKIRIIGTLKSKNEPKIGQKTKLDNCSIKEGNYHFELFMME